MTIRQTIEKLLTRGSAPEDPDALVEIALVPIGSGPMTVASLRESGFEATGAESFNIVTDVLSDYRILVPRRQAAEATARLQDLL
ncbi:MAG: hypothetical protein QOJ08_656 [Ilumatobacteraceae bacterium]|jgi:hypothetical protein